MFQVGDIVITLDSGWLIGDPGDRVRPGTNGKVVYFNYAQNSFDVDFGKKGVHPVFYYEVRLLTPLELELL